MRLAIVLCSLVLATSTGRAGDLREGANHHLGDDSFLTAFGRGPAPDDVEAVRMHVHLAYVRALLAARPATSPALAARRTELLGYLDDYIAAGTTPRNTYVPWRTPVFIDADDHICAVGYLIERSAGRALPETIAATHRLDHLEDIAAAMPEVAAWVASSGFTLDELASIQPGYEGPEVQHLGGWDDAKIVDGPYRDEKDGVAIVGAFANRRMTGTWTHTVEGKVVGSGRFRDGRGRWKSLRPDGSVMAIGAFRDNHADGTWRFFHPSGRLAAIGEMRDGHRDGTWTFYYDAPGSIRLASGPFVSGEVIGDWKHYDPTGKLVATASGAPWSDTGLTLSVRPGKDGVRHEITQGEPASAYRLDAFFLGDDKLYLMDSGEMFDQDGNELDKADGTWLVRTCNWSAKRKRLAAAGATPYLYKLLGRRGADRGEMQDCPGEPLAMPAARARRYDAMLASRATVHAPIPDWAFGGEGDADEDLGEGKPGDNPFDLATYLADHMTWYMEWPHIDGTFMTVYRSLPGYDRTAY